MFNLAPPYVANLALQRRSAERHRRSERVSGCRRATVAIFAVAALAGSTFGQGPSFPSSQRSPYVPDNRPTAWQQNAQPPGRSPAAIGADDREWWRIAQQPDASAPPATESAPPAEAPSEAALDQSSQEREELWDAQLKAIAAQIDAAKKRSEELAEEKEVWEAKENKLAEESLRESRPYSFLLLDKARDEVAAETQHGAALSADIAAAKVEVTEARTDQEEKERALHRLEDKLEQNEDPAAALELSDAVAEAQHASDVVNQELELARLELANLQQEQHVHSLRLEHAQQRVERYKQDVVFTLSTLDQVLVALRAREKALADRAKEVDDDLNKFLNEQWYQARKQLEEARAARDQSKVPVLEAEVQAKNLARQAALLEAKLISEQQERLKRLKEAWQRRYELATQSVSSAEMAQWVADAKEALDLWRTDAVDTNGTSANIRKQLTSVDRKSQSTDESDTSLRYWLTRSSKSLEAQRRYAEDVLAQMETDRRVVEKLLEDLTSGDWSLKVRRWIAEGWQSVQQVWDYELAAVDERPITVGKIIQGIILLLAGIYASRYISRGMGRRLLTRVGIDASAAAAMQSVTFYTLVLLFTLFALKLVQVPLTVFTLLGGALALGIGFGSQNIVNNFISGLILLAERPVRVGDLIQLDQVYGNVEHIGARSTRIRTGDNLEIIVPNSTFLQTNVVNWTLSDNNMRTCVTFGVIYGSPLGKVTHLALKAAANHDRVFDRPEPFVIFNEFGDNALVFELHVWVAVRTLMERRKIESDIRFNLDHLFREAGIVIAFPQRDVHLFTAEPLRVQMASPPSDSDGPAAGNAA